MEQTTFPTEDMALTHILVVTDMYKAKIFYKDVLGAKIFREYSGTSCVLQFLNNWFLLVTSGGPTEDKPTVHFQPSINIDSVAHAFTIRVKDCMGSYEILKSRGAEFLTPPLDRGEEVRAFFRDPDGNLFEISQA